MKIYIRSAAALSPQNTLEGNGWLTLPVTYTGNRLQAIEPAYAKIIDAKSLRRMSRVIRMGVATASACLKDADENNPGGICMGTAYGSLQDTDVFLTEVTERNEDGPPPTAFIQSTHNVVGAQVALMLKCHSYNNTFVHGGFSFESALLDAMLLLKEQEADTVLTGSVDELTDRSYAILERFGLLKKESDTAHLYASQTKGTIVGEGSAFFLLSSRPSTAHIAELKGLHTFYKLAGTQEISTQIHSFLASCKTQLADIDLVITGKNGDAQNDRVYEELGASVFTSQPIVNYKHLCGEYPTAVSFALWMGTDIIKTGTVPAAIQTAVPGNIKTILIYNHYRHTQHSLLLLSAV